MKSAIFTGPTLAGDPVLASHDFLWLPPAGEGDVYRIACKRPKAIGLIDGQFETMPSVWHKEILWALSKGIAVYGAASMGALRAAELQPFGMIGVGGIYRDYASGRLARDDEVALLHAPAELGYCPLSEALVDIRATLAAAQAARAVSHRTADRMAAVASAQFFKERTWKSVLAGARAERIAERDIEAMVAFLKTGRVARKRRDARNMVARMRRDLSMTRPLRKAGFEFQHTIYWQTLVDRNAPE